MYLNGFLPRYNIICSNVHCCVSIRVKIKTAKNNYQKKPEKKKFSVHQTSNSTEKNLVEIALCNTEPPGKIELQTCTTYLCEYLV